jgi:hypothetical protein
MNKSQFFNKLQLAHGRLSEEAMEMKWRQLLEEMERNQMAYRMMLVREAEQRNDSDSTTSVSSAAASGGGTRGVVLEPNLPLLLGQVGVAYYVNSDTGTWWLYIVNTDGTSRDLDLGIDGSASIDQFNRIVQQSGFCARFRTQAGDRYLMFDIDGNVVLDKLYTGDTDFSNIDGYLVLLVNYQEGGLDVTWFDGKNASSYFFAGGTDYDYGSYTANLTRDLFLPFYVRGLEKSCFLAASGQVIPVDPVYPVFYYGSDEFFTGETCDFVATLRFNEATQLYESLTIVQQSGVTSSYDLTQYSLVSRNAGNAYGQNCFFSTFTTESGEYFIINYDNDTRALSTFSYVQDSNHAQTSIFFYTPYIFGSFINKEISGSLTFFFNSGGTGYSSGGTTYNYGDFVYINKGSSEFTTVRAANGQSTVIFFGDSCLGRGSVGANTPKFLAFNPDVNPNFIANFLTPSGLVQQDTGAAGADVSSIYDEFGSSYFGGDNYAASFGLHDSTTRVLVLGADHIKRSVTPAGIWWWSFGGGTMIFVDSGNSSNSFMYGGDTFFPFSNQDATLLGWWNNYWSLNRTGVVTDILPAVSEGYQSQVFSISAGGQGGPLLVPGGVVEKDSPTFYFSAGDLLYYRYLAGSPESEHYAVVNLRPAYWQTVVNTAYLYTEANLATALSSTAVSYVRDGARLVFSSMNDLVTFYGDLVSASEQTQPIGNTGYSLGVGTRLLGSADEIYLEIAGAHGNQRVVTFQLMTQITRQADLPSGGNSPDGTVAYGAIYVDWNGDGVGDLKNQNFTPNENCDPLRFEGEIVLVDSIAPNLSEEPYTGIVGDRFLLSLATAHGFLLIAGTRGGFITKEIRTIGGIYIIPNDFTITS